MLVELGNPAPVHHPADNGKQRTRLDGHRVTEIRIPGGDGGHTMPDAHSDDLFPAPLAEALAGVTARATRRMLIDGWLAQDMHGLPNHEALQSVIHPGAGWFSSSDAPAPTWVRSDHSALEAMLAEYFGCPIGPPDNFEDTHWTRNGMPGVGPGPFAGAVMLKTNAGNDIQSIQMGGGLLGETGTATATSATSLTTNSAVNHAANDLAGQVVLAWTTGVYGLITANTSAATNTVLTVDRWSTPSTPGGAAASTPSATTGYTILSGGPPAWFMGLTATATAPTGSDVTLAGEITTAGGGLIRKICPYAHTAAAASFTLTPVFTATGSDSLPVTVAKVGVSQSMVSTTRNLFQTLPNATATFALSGDSATYTESVSL